MGVSYLGLFPGLPLFLSLFMTTKVYKTKIGRNTRYENYIMGINNTIKSATWLNEYS